MTRIVTALYDTLAQAELALAHLASEVGVEDGEVVDRSIAGRTRFARMKLSDDERETAAAEIEQGGYVLIARVSKAHDPDLIVRLLKNIPRDGLGKEEAATPGRVGEYEGFRVEDPNQASGATPAAPAVPAAPALARGAATAPVQAAPPAPARGKVGQFEGFRVEDPNAAQSAPAPTSAPPEADADSAPRRVGAWEGFRVERPSAPEQAAAPAPRQVAEERIPIVEEELRIGTREVVRGGARVRSHIEEHPVRQEVDLLSEHTSMERRPATRTLSEEELERGGLLRERVIEISEMREEAVVSKEAFVREELVVSKSIERRVERIDETVRRTEVETERLPGAADRPAFGGFAAPKAPEPDGR